MDELELLESEGQMNIFDYIDVGQDSKRTRKLVEGDKVKLRFYVDEIDYIALCHPQLLGEGIVNECFTNCCMVSIAGDLIKVDNEKLLLISVEG